MLASAAGAVALFAAEAGELAVFDEPADGRTALSATAATSTAGADALTAAGEATSGPGAEPAGWEVGVVIGAVVGNVARRYVGRADGSPAMPASRPVGLAVGSPAVSFSRGRMMTRVDRPSKRKSKG